jgi:hypothetical protein
LKNRPESAKVEAEGMMPSMMIDAISDKAANAFEEGR